MSQSTTRLREMCEFVIDCPHFTPDWTDFGFMVIRNQNIRDGRLDLSNPSYTHRQDFDRRNRRAKPQGGDIIFTREAPMGEVCIVPNKLECCIGQRQVLLRPTKEVDGKYLFYALQSNYVRHQIFWNEGTGSTVSNLRIPVLEMLKIPRLGPSEGSIGHLLGALDDKIELNRRMNETLEAMARAVFKDWLVDFGPTRGKMEGREPYLAPKIWSLFPDQLDGQGKPQGWAKEQLLKHAHLLSGGTPKTAEPAYWGGPIRWASAKDVSQCGELFLLETERSITARGLEESSTRIIPSLSTIVVARGATTGRFCMFGSEIAMNQTCYALSTKTARPFWINCIFASLVDSIVHAAHGSVFDTITTRTIESAMTIVPNDALLDQFENIVRPFFMTILKNTEVSRTLAATRDILLPKLMSGEIQLRDAEKMLEVVA